MNILLIGNGGREHALAWKISQSSQCSSLYIAPGNAGTATAGTNVAISPDDFASITTFCLEKKIDLLVVGPEGPLVKGIRDFIEQQKDLQNMMIVGPGESGAKLEGSKDFSKQFMLRHGIPTAKARTFNAAEIEESLLYIDEGQPPFVLKADGLAAGKGVVISESKEESKIVLREMLEQKKFGEASAKILIEEFLEGIELSVFVLTDGENYVILPEAKDYKRVGDGDTGPNTGGMGAVSPVPFASPGFLKRVEEKIIWPTISGLKKDNIHYKGFIFFGLMKVKDEPYLIEYNARMGDPETQVVMCRIENDLVDLLVATATANLAGKKVLFAPETALAVALVSGGYPGDYQKGRVITGLEKKHKSIIFHAGTKRNGNQFLTDGGRVLAVTAKGKDITEARRVAYQSVSEITWQDLYFRKDIGLDLLNLR